MAENLKVTRYNDGSVIDYYSNDSDGIDAWPNLTTGGYSINSEYEDFYGYLYNWYAIDENIGLCPTGWRVPSKQDYEILGDYLGENSGLKMKDSENFNGTNESGFKALPAGERSEVDASYGSWGPNGTAYLWTATLDHLNDRAYYLYLHYSSNDMNYSAYYKDMGGSVRCLESIEGCTHPNATNYDETANVDDGSCEYPDNGDYSLSFDGDDDYVGIPDIEVGNTYTIETNIFLRDDDISGQDFYSIINGWKGDGASSNCQFGVVAPHDKPYDNKLGYYKNGQGSVYGNKPDRNRYLKLNLVRDGSNFKLYINNQLVAHEQHTDWNDDIYNRIGVWHINDEEISNRETWHGNIDDLKIWDYVLSYEEINQNENSNNSENLIVDYQFNSGDGNTLYDHSGNGNHGTINGATWVENIYGCTEDLAINYNLLANWDDGSCEYPDNGDYSLSFDGVDDYLEISHIDDYSFNLGEQTIQFDLNISRLNQNQVQSDYIIWKIDESPGIGNASLGFDVGLTSNHIYFRHWDGNSGPVEVNILLDLIGLGFSTISFTSDSDFLKAYINDSLVDSEQMPENYEIGKGESPIYLAGLPPVTSTGNAQDIFYGGFLDNFKIWNISFSSEELQLINENNLFNESLVGNFKFNSGEGDILYDHSNNGNHGSIHGAKWLINGTKHVAVDGSDEEGNGSLDSPFSSIQYAIDTVSDGDTIFVSAGTYYENINFNGKNIALIGEDRETTIIDGGGWGAVVTFENNEGIESMLSSFTIQNGYKTQYEFTWPHNYGGGIYCQNSSPTIYNCTVKDNNTLGDSLGLGGGGAGIFIYQNSSPVLEDLYIYNNSGVHGGGIFVFENSSVIIQSSVIDSNYASNNGGGISIEESSSIIVSNSSIINNQSDIHGGGLYLNNSSINASSLNISSNSADEDGGDTDYGQGLGGGLFASNSEININDSSIINSNYANQRGGGLYVVVNSNLNIIDSFISNNQAKNDVGGAIELNSSDGYVENCVINANSASNTAGIAVISQSNLNIFKTVFYENDSYEYGRGILHIHVNSYAYAENIVVSHNYSTDHILSPSSASNLIVKNSIIANNQFDESLVGNDYDNFSSNVYYDVFNISFSNIQGGWEGEGNIDFDAQFTDPDNGDYTLQPSSSCIDAGDPNSPLDPDGTRVDMGAYPVYQESYGTLHSGANLKSFYTLPENTLLSNVVYSLGNDVTGVITEGGAASQLSPGTWVGSLTEISPEKGYWIILDTERALTIYDGEPSESLVYNLHSGANLISFPSNGSANISDALPDDIENSITGIITEGGATTQLGPGFWVGSLTTFQGGKGYWMISDDDISFSYDLSTLSRSNIAYKEEKLNGYDYTQSSQQAFYFVESVEGINDDDYILSFNGDKLIGSRQWQGSIIDVPAMGNDGNSYSNGYMKAGATPTFKLLSNGKLTALEGDIPAWSDNGLFMISSLSKVVIPESYSLSQAYPNPFNPTTTLNFAIPVDNEVALSIYNLQGREVATLINGNMKAGYHSITWDASSNASGVYFVKMLSGEYVNTQKLMLVK